MILEDYEKTNHGKYWFICLYLF